MKKILVIRFSSIGDIVLTSPVIRCLKQQMEKVEVHVLTKTQYKSLYAFNPYVDQLHLWGEENQETIKDLKAARFDYVIDLHKNLRTKRVKSLLRKPFYSFPKLNFQKWLYVNFKWNYLPDIHIVDRYFKAVEPLKIQNDEKGLDFFISLDEEKFQQKFPFSEKYIAVAIGGKFATKRMPVEKLSETLKNIPVPLVLLGGKEDFERGEQLRKSLSTQEFLNGCGGFSIHESAQIIKDAAVLVTHDTGMMHIGSAFDLPIVSIWGNTVKDFGMYPYRPQRPHSFSIHEVDNLDCRPCSKIGYQKCPKGHFKCMLHQDTKAIHKQIMIFLETMNP